MKNDPRVNTKNITIRNYIIIFLFALAFCSSYVGIYVVQMHASSDLYIILSMITYIVVLSASICVMFALIRRKLLMKPVYLLGDAARRVAGGDYSVRIPPQRTDGKKDEFEVIYDDFNLMASELASTEMLKNDFVSNVSHELKTPLAVIQNYATVLQSEALDEEERREYSQKISEAADRLSTLVTNILQVNRIENQKIKPKTQPFNVSEAISRCILNYDLALEAKNITLDTNLDQDLVLDSDENLLDMVWNNLIGNAVKFTPENGRIQISLSKEGDAVRAVFADNGCGIAPDAIKHIFDKFYQADTSHATQGNGLGLTLAKRIVTLLGGEISVQSEPGKGSEFIVLLPTK